jgi:hypothetical protein
MALYLNDRHRLVSSAILTIGWVQAAHLSARPILFGSPACQSSTCILVRYRRYGAPSVTEGEDRSFRTIAAACSRYGVVVADHLVVVGWRPSSAFLGGPPWAGQISWSGSVSHPPRILPGGRSGSEALCPAPATPGDRRACRRAERTARAPWQTRRFPSSLASTTTTMRP